MGRKTTKELVGLVDTRSIRVETSPTLVQTSPTLVQTAPTEVVGSPTTIVKTLLAGRVAADYCWIEVDGDSGLADGRRVAFRSGSSESRLAITDARLTTRRHRH